MLPIVQRELRVASRNPKLYSSRLRWGLLQAFGALLVLFSSGGGFRPQAAQWLFSTLSHLALVLALLDGVRKGSDALSQEKREGTLGFLFLSTLNGLDVVLGKFSGAFIRSLSGLLSFLPILATTLLVGGTTLGEFWRVAAVLVSGLCASLAICLFTSSISQEKSVVAGLTAVVTMAVLPLFIGVWPGFDSLRGISPFALLDLSKDLSFANRSHQFGYGLLALWTLIATTLGAAALITPRAALDRSRRQRAINRSARLPFLRAKLLSENPVLWLNYDQQSAKLLAVVSVCLLLLGLGPCAGIWLAPVDRAAWAAFPGVAAGVLTVVISLRVTLHATNCAAKARQEGSLELLLSTPLTIQEIYRGWWLALGKGIRLPLISLFVLIAVAVALTAHTSIGQAIWTGKWLIEVLLEIPVLAAVGMWMGLSAKSRATAVIYTLLLGGLAPWMVCVFTMPVQVILFFQAMDRVKKVFQSLRNGDNALGVRELMRPPIHSAVPLPPVIR